jgi:hypothetical protein
MKILILILRVKLILMNIIKIIFLMKMKQQNIAEQNKRNKNKKIENVERC